MPLALGAMLCCLRWHDTRRSRWLALAGLLIGIGLSTKILFIWFIAGSVSAGMMVWLVNWWWPLDREGWALPRRSLKARLTEPPAIGRRDLLAGVAGFLLGAAPLIGYNLASAGTLKVLRANSGQTEKGVDNTALLDNLGRRFDDFKTLLEGSYFWFLGETHANLLPLSVFVGARVVLALLIWRVPRISSLSRRHHLPRHAHTRDRGAKFGVGLRPGGDPPADPAANPLPADRRGRDAARPVAGGAG